MLTSSLLSLLPDREAFVRSFNALGIPGVTMSVEKSVKCGITGLHVSMKVDGKDEHEHHHDHGHEGVHHTSIGGLPI